MKPLRLLPLVILALTLLAPAATSAPNQPYAFSSGPTQFTDISATGTVVFGPGQSANSGRISLSRPVLYRGRSYNELQVVTSGGYVGLSNPGAGQVYPFAFYTGYDNSSSTTGTNGGVYRQQIGNELIVQFNLRRTSEGGGPFTNRFQIRLRTDSSTVHVDFLSGTGNGISGIYDNATNYYFFGSGSGQTFSSFGPAANQPFPTNQRLSFFVFELNDVPDVTADPTPTITGVVEGTTPVTVNVYAGSDTSGVPVDSGTVVPVDNQFVYTTTDLPDGIYTVQASRAGQTTAAETFRVDTTAPVPTLNAVNAGSDNTPTFSGTGGIAPGDSASVSIRIYADGDETTTPVQTLTASLDDEGDYSVDAAALDDRRTYSAVVSQGDNQGNVGSSTAREFIVDTAAPTVTLDGPTGSINDSTPTYSGDSEAAAGSVRVRVYAGAAVSGTPVQTLTTAQNAVTRGYSIDGTTDLIDGVYTAQADQSDESGNGGLSSPTTFTVDSTAPTPTLEDPADRTADSTPTFVGDSGVAEGDNDPSIRVYRASDTDGRPVVTFSAGADDDGDFSTATPETLADGAYTVDVVQSDTAGNSSTSTSYAFTVDTTAPAPTVTAPSGRTGDSTPTVSGEAGVAAGDAPTVAIRITTGSPSVPVQSFSADVAEDGIYSADVPVALLDGEYTVETSQSDDLGAAGSDTSTFTVDTVAPTVTLLAPAAGTRTDDQTPTFSGTAGTGTGDDTSVNVDVREGTDVDGLVVQTVVAAVNADGTYSAEPDVLLARGQYTAVARQSDDLGNDAESAPTTFRVILTPSDVSVTASSSSETVVVGDTVTETFSVSADGAEAPGSTFALETPANASLVSSSSSQGTCGGERVVACELGTIADGGTATVVVVLRAEAEGRLTATGSVSSAADDPDASNDSASTATTVTAAPVPPARSVAPGVTTGDGQTRGQHSVSVSGIVDPNGSATTYSFEYGLDAGYGQRTGPLTVSGADPVNVEALIDALELGETYHYRLVAVNDAGTSVGEDRTVRTLARVAPGAFTSKASVKRDTKRPYRFTFSGRVGRPAGVSAKDGCNGKVTVQIKNGPLTVSAREVKVRSDCTWRSSVTFRKRSRLGNSGRLKVEVRYAGGLSLAPKRAKALFVRFK